MHHEKLGSTSLASMIVVTVAGAGCASDSAPVSSADDRALVASFPAGDTRFDAVGGVGVASNVPDGSGSARELVCTGTLIAPTVVVTAKHCLDAAHDFGENYRLIFMTGADGYAPRQVHEVLATGRAPHDHGGYTGYGRDVGVLHLTKPVVGVTPARVAGLTDAMVGKDFLTLGYGNMDETVQYGTRRIGNIRLKARTGLVYEQLLGSFEAFYEFETGQPLLPECNTPSGQTPSLGDVIRGRGGATCQTAELVRAVYDSYRLEQLDEVAAGGGLNDAQPCSGDSGGPLLTSERNGTLTVYAVISGGLSSRSLNCANGGIYASFAPDVLSFLGDAIAWRDPCANLPAEGMCLGNVAHRCASVYEGPRRHLTFDCSSTATTCQRQGDGTIGCGAGPGLPRPTGSADASALPIDPSVFGRRAFLQPGDRLSRRP